MKRIEAVRAWAHTYGCPPGHLCLVTHQDRQSAVDCGGKDAAEWKLVRVRIIREADYRRLLQAAKGKL